MALIDKASLLMVPSTYEAGTLYNVLPSGNRAPDSTNQNSGYDQTRADFDFDRGSNASATRINSSGLIEKYRENLFTQSNNFSDSDWTPKAGTFTQGIADPDGGNNAWSWLATNTDPYLYQAIGTSGVFTLSIYAKGVGSTIGKVLELRNGSTTQNFTLTSEWQRFELYAAAGGSNIGFEFGNPAVAGDVLYIYAAQWEKGLVASSYLDSTSVTGKAGVLVDLPRINYDANGENGSLLLEPSRANSVPYSEGGFAYQTSTSGTGITPVITENAAISPEGVQNAFKVVLNRGAGNTSGDWSWIYQNNVTYYNGDNRVSVYLKAATSSDIGKEVFIRVASDGQAVTLTEDWKRHDFNRPTSGLTSDAGFYTRGGSSVDNEVSFFVYGFQVEQNATYPSSYIPTMGTSETRSADSCSVTGVSDVIGQSEGVVYFEWDYQNVGSSGGNIVVSLAGASLQELYFWVKTDGSYVYDVYDSTRQAGITGSIGSFGIKKIALVYKNNDFALYINGVLVGSDTNGSVPTLTDAYIGKYALNNNYNISSGIKQVALFKERLSNAELAALTA